MFGMNGQNLGDIEADIAAPVVELGLQTVVVSISATIELDTPR